MSATDDVLSAIRAGDALALDAALGVDPTAADARDGNGVSAVLLALYHRRPDLADLLLAHDPTLGAPEFAALGMRDELAAALDSRAARATDRSADGFPLLGLAAFFGQPATVDLLLERKAPVEDPSRNDMKVRPLHAAAAGGHAEIVARLLAAGAEPSPVQHGGWTPLHQAASLGDEAMVRSLLDAGADRTARAADGRTPREMARDAGHEGVVALLE